MQQVKRMLINYNSSQGRIESIKLKIKDLEYEYIKTGGVGNHSPGHTSNPTENQVIKLQTQMQELKDEKRGIEQTVKKIDAALKQIHRTDKKILTMKYIQDRKWFEVSASVKIVARHCMRRAKKAIEKLEEIMM